MEPLTGRNLRYALKVRPRLLLLCIPVWLLQAGSPGRAAPPAHFHPLPLPASPPLVLPAPEPAEVPAIHLRGRVFEKGSVTPLAGAVIQADSGEAAVTSADGRFDLFIRQREGPVTLFISEPLHLPVRTTWPMPAGPVSYGAQRSAASSIEMIYRLLPLYAHGRRPYTATVRGARSAGEGYGVRDDELRTLPGSLGDPFRIIGMLPGVATPVPLLPAYVVRGASPGENGYILDGMPVPQLFHLLVGGGVVHSRFVDRLDFYPGSYDVTLGRFAGGVVDAETRGAQGPAARDAHGEVELKLYDLSAAAEFKLKSDVRVTLSGHYGYPGPILHAIDNRVNLSYWDYQVRLDWHGLTVEALGSYDDLTLTRQEIKKAKTIEVPDDFILTFHRLQVRQRGQNGRLSYEAAVGGGIDQMQVFGGSGVRKLALFARANLRLLLPYFIFQAGVDGEASRFQGQNFGAGQAITSPDELGELAGTRDGLVGSAFVLGTVPLFGNDLSLTLGVRVDAYSAAGVTLLGIDPRGSIRYHPVDWLTLNAGGGLYQQPPAFPVPLPGLSTFALQLGLQQSIQGEVGVQAKLPDSVEISVKGYYQHFHNVNDFNINDFNIKSFTSGSLGSDNLVLNFATLVCTSPPPDSLSGIPAQGIRQLDGESFGTELLVRRRAGRFTGWIAYTLSRSERRFSCGLLPADFDQTHVLNVVGQVRLPWNIIAGARIYLATGRPVTTLKFPQIPATVRNNDRLPTYVQLDLRVDREWIFDRFSLSAFLEVVNATFSTASFGLSYPTVNGMTRFDQAPSVNGFPFILPSLGLRGRF